MIHSTPIFIYMENPKSKLIDCVLHTPDGLTNKVYMQHHQDGLTINVSMLDPDQWAPHKYQELKRIFGEATEVIREEV